MAGPTHTKVRLGQIGYLNVLPVYHGLANGMQPPWLEVIRATPAELNGRMAAGTLEISPISSAAYAHRPERWLLLPDLAITCAGPVDSVLLCAQVPFQELHGRGVILTEESASAAALLKLLCRQADIEPRYTTAPLAPPEVMRRRAEGVLVIGDRALRHDWRAHFSHVFDLGEVWHRRTGLPFVFALWAVQKSYARAHPIRVGRVLECLNASRRKGCRQLARIVAQASQSTGLDHQRLADYFDHMDYHLTPAALNGLQHFYDGLHRTGLIPDPVYARFFRPAGESRLPVAAA